MTNADQHLIEHLSSREELLTGNFLHVRRDTVRLPNQRSATREYIQHSGAVMVIPLLDDGRVVLERQFRYPIGKVLIEFPAGKIDAGEDPLRCGQRELLEETGYTAKEWAYAGELHPVVAYSTEAIQVFFARGLTLGQRKLDEGEFLDVFTASQAELLEWCLSGKVTDSKTLAGMLWLQNYSLGARALQWQPA
ncbi:NUDIX domain-containing protein [Variovorax sp. HJSM1_2]|uniref:NUDIX domain-containing protein n=1 Tax=Variovorax sp. HJSM1_2 TaxID=3366263 RepID=UPI003BE2A1DC